MLLSDSSNRGDVLSATSALGLMSVAGSLYGLSVIIIEKSNPVLRLPTDSGNNRADYIPGIYLSCHGLEILFYAVSEWVFHTPVLKVTEQYGALLSVLILITDFPCINVSGIKGRDRIAALFRQHHPPLSQQPIQVIMVYFV